MTLQQLKYIVALDKERHFARAAELCIVSQPGLTIQVKKLEAEIGIQIFDRSKVPLTPTPLGKKIIHRAKIVLKEVEGIRDFVIEQKNSLQGQLVLGVVSTLTPYLIPLIIDRIQAKTPKIEYSIKEKSTIELLASLDNGEIDVALMSTPTGKKHLREYPIFHESFVAYLPSSHPRIKDAHYQINVRDTSKLLLLTEEYCYNAQLLNICHLKSDKLPNRRVNFDITSIESLKNFVRANLGVAIVPELSIVHEDKKGTVKSFESPVPTREISLVVSERFSRKVLLENMGEAIWESLPQTFKKDKKHRRIRWDDSPYFRKAVEIT